MSKIAALAAIFQLGCDIVHDGPEACMPANFDLLSKVEKENIEKRVREHLVKSVHECDSSLVEKDLEADRTFD